MAVDEGKVDLGTSALFAAIVAATLEAIRTGGSQYVLSMEMSDKKKGLITTYTYKTMRPRCACIEVTADSECYIREGINGTKKV